MLSTQPLVLKRFTTASFDVDAQKGFTPLCPDELPVPGGDEIVGALNQQASMARIRVGSKDAHCAQAVWVARPEAPMFTPVEGFPNADLHWPRHCEPGTRGFELLDGLPHDMDYDFFVYKGIAPDVHPYGACYHDLHDRRSTGVIEVLRAQGITTVLVGGLATDYCVKTTALQLAQAGFRVVVNQAACRGIAPDTVATAYAELAAAGVVLVDDLTNVAVQ